MKVFHILCTANLADDQESVVLYELENLTESQAREHIATLDGRWVWDDGSSFDEVEKYGDEWFTQYELRMRTKPTYQYLLLTVICKEVQHD